MLVSIIIPVYNERLNVERVLSRVLAAPLPVGCSRELIVVDDGSTDGTSELLKKYKNEPLIVIHESIVNFGKGAAIRIGLAKAKGDLILIQDGDMEYDPNDYPKILQPLIDGTATVVYGSRFMGSVQGMQWANWLANKLLTLTVNILYGARITDEATAYKAFRRYAVERFHLKCLRFEFCPEITAKFLRTGNSILEVPISYNARGYNEGKKIHWYDGVEAIWALIKYRVIPMNSFVVDNRQSEMISQLDEDVSSRTSPGKD
jgi:dolichol-phosphate mannosyltransferase